MPNWAWASAIGEDDGRGALVELACNAQDQHGPGVGEHAAAERLVEAVAHACHLLRQQEHGDDRHKEVHVEHDSHVGGAVGVVEAGDEQAEMGQHEEERAHQRHIDEDIGELQRHKLPGFMLIAQVVEHDGGPGIDGHANSHGADVPHVVGIAHGGGQRLEARQHKQREDKGHGTHHAQGGAVDHAGVLAFLVGKAEERGLHAEGEGDDEDAYVTINIGDNTKLTSASHPSVGLDGHEQIVDKPSGDGTDAVDGCVFQE